DPLDELRCAFSMTGATVGGDGGAHVGDRRLDPERLKEVQEQLGVLRSIYRASTPHLRVAELAKQDPKLAIRPAALHALGRPPFTDPLEEGRATQVHPGREVGLAQVG